MRLHLLNRYWSPRGSPSAGAMRHNSKRSRCVSKYSTSSIRRDDVHWLGFRPRSAMTPMVYLIHGSLHRLYCTVTSCFSRKRRSTEAAAACSRGGGSNRRKLAGPREQSERNRRGRAPGSSWCGRRARG